MGFPRSAGGARAVWAEAKALQTSGRQVSLIPPCLPVSGLSAEKAGVQGGDIICLLNVFCVLSLEPLLAPVWPGSAPQQAAKLRGAGPYGP